MSIQQPDIQIESLHDIFFSNIDANSIVPSYSCWNIPRLGFRRLGLRHHDDCKRAGEPQHVKVL